MFTNLAEGLVAVRLSNDCDQIPSVLVTESAFSVDKEGAKDLFVFPEFQEFDDCAISVSLRNDAIVTSLIFVLVLVGLTLSSFFLAGYNIVKMIKYKRTISDLKPSDLGKQRKIGANYVLKLVEFHSWIIVFWCCFLVILCLFPLLLSLTYAAGMSLCGDEDEVKEFLDEFSVDIQRTQVHQLFKSVMILFVGLVSLCFLDILRCCIFCGNCFSTGNTENDYVEISEHDLNTPMLKSAA